MTTVGDSFFGFELNVPFFMLSAETIIRNQGAILCGSVNFTHRCLLHINKVTSRAHLCFALSNKGKSLCHSVRTRFKTLKKKKETARIASESVVLKIGRAVAHNTNF
ncbi:Hypothetical predicted protein [Cloeon dipterum]|uniref:Uncharacterized protein n=1 Tax=Cloeon dipterum TaxID=197152 RepID=A0A8S1C9Y4_9INSE|nr:Hypothetical predicted protein [Cloeon dipterum]